MASIKIQDLRKSFLSDFMVKKTEVLKGLSLTVKEGEIYGFLGQNGAGKTTTIKCLLGLIKADSGTMTILGDSAKKANSRRHIGFLPEHPYFYDYLTVEELLLFSSRLFSVKRDQAIPRIRNLISQVGMSGREHLKLRKLSKGMIQRIGLAQALINDPKILILDEPFSGLDPIGRKEVRDIILELKEQGKTVFFSSHILQDMEMIADRVGILKNGVLIREGDLQELVSGRIDHFELVFKSIDPEELDRNQISYSIRGDQFTTRTETQDSVNQLIAKIVRLKGEIVAVNPIRQTLEDVFLKEIDHDH